MPPSDHMTNQAAPYGSYGYPGMPPAYHQGPASLANASPSHEPYGQSGYQPYSQVGMQLVSESEVRCRSPEKTQQVL